MTGDIIAEKRGGAYNLYLKDEVNPNDPEGIQNRNLCPTLP